MQETELGMQTLLQRQTSFEAQTALEGQALFEAQTSLDAAHYRLHSPGNRDVHHDKWEEEPHLSKSSLNRYITCPYSYFLQYKLKLRPVKQDIDLLIGSATHHLIASHYLAKKEGEVIDLAAAEETFWSRYSGKDSPTAEETEMAKTESRRYVGLFIQSISIEPREIEKAFSVPIVNLDNGDALPISLVGIVDLLDQLEGIPRPLEIKTKAKKADDWSIRMSLEMTAYAYWVKYTSMLNADEDIPVGYLNIIKTKTPTIQQQTDTRSMRDFLDFYQTAKAVWENITEERFYRNPGTHCNWCNYISICRRDRDEIIKTFGNAAYLGLWEKDLI